MVKKNSGYVIFLCFILLLRQGAGFCEKNENLKLNADKLIYSQDSSQVNLVGNVRFDYKNTVMTGQAAFYDINTQKGNLRGGVRIVQPGINITGREMKVDYSKNKAVLEGNVKVVTTKTIRDGINGRGSQTTLFCQKLDYDWVMGDGTASGSVKVVQSDKRAFADRAFYNGAVETILLTGNVKFEQGSNNWMTSNEALVDMRKEVFLATGGVHANFLVEESGQEKSKVELMMNRHPDKIPIPAPQFRESMISEYKY